MNMLRRVLIANRGEIVRRIARTCHRLGVEHVAVYSEADAGAPYLRGAGATVYIGPPAPARSYLNGERLIAAAHETGCDAIHPGYGFLSENAGFARAVEDAGLTFIGPSAGTIAELGDKARSKAIMAAAGVPVVPGSPELIANVAQADAVVREIGFPALLKPVAGGGGKGMTVIEGAEALQEAVESAMRLAQANFGDPRLLAERYIAGPRHVEVQIFGDAHGNIVHLFERECSLQRRHQKIIEEAPAPCLAPQLRDLMLKAAVRGARAIGYRNAGTFEFILAPDGEFYFLEVNTRLQVEHPVTEEITGLDLVEWQLRVAAGESLPLSQEQIQARGHAIECRIYAEDPTAQFRPAPGRALRVIWPRRLRIESAVEDGSVITSHYDPMVAKMISRAGSRPQALASLRDGLAETRIVGLTTNVAFLSALLEEAQVLKGSLHTGLVDERLSDLARAPDVAAAVACAGALILAQSRPPQSTSISPWLAGGSAAPLDRALLDPAAPLGRVSVRSGRQWMSARILDPTPAAIRIGVGDETFAVSAASAGDGLWSGKVDDHDWTAVVTHDAIELVISGQRVCLDASHDAASFSESGLTAMAPMPGVIVGLSVSIGDKVNKGQTLAVVEAMKMENPVTAPADATVTDVRCAIGDAVTAGQVLILLGDAEEDLSASARRSHLD